jgi:hypothetical protein
MIMKAWTIMGLSVGVLLVAAGCGSDDSGSSGRATGGTGGANAGGADTGGTSTGGANAGGADTGGTSTGGVNAGGADTGGTGPGGAGPGTGGTGTCPYTTTTFNCTDACANLRSLAADCQSAPNMPAEVATLMTLAAQGNGAGCRTTCNASSTTYPEQWACVQGVPAPSTDCTQIAGCNYVQCD